MTDSSTLAGSAQAINPYAPPQASITPGGGEAPDNAEETRRQFLNHETSIKGVGSLYILGAIFMGIAAVGSIGVSLLDSDVTAMMIGVGVFYALFSWISFYLGSGLRRLDPKVRVGTTILATLGLIAIPFGTLINAYVLYLLHSKKGKRVMTAEYQAIIAETPHIKYRTPLWLIIVALLLVALLIFGMVAAMQS